MYVSTYYQKALRLRTSNVLFDISLQPVSPSKPGNTFGSILKQPHYRLQRKKTSLTSTNKSTFRQAKNYANDAYSWLQRPEQRSSQDEFAHKIFLSNLYNFHLPERKEWQATAARTCFVPKIRSVIFKCALVVRITFQKMKLFKYEYIRTRTHSIWQVFYATLAQLFLN